MQEVLFKISVYDESFLCTERLVRGREQGEHSIQLGPPGHQPNFIARSD